MEYICAGIGWPPWQPEFVTPYARVLSQDTNSWIEISFFSPYFKHLRSPIAIAVAVAQHDPHEPWSR